MGITTVRAKVRKTRTQLQTEAIPFISRELFELSPFEVAEKLWESGVQGNCEVGIQLSDVPVGTPIRKLMGEQIYLRAETNSFCTPSTEGGVLMVADGYRLSQMAPDLKVVAKLMDLFTGDEWDAIDSCLGDYRCPK